LGVGQGRGNTQFKSIVTHILGDGVRPIAKWMKLPIGSCEALFLKMQQNLVAHLEFVWDPMLIMAPLVLGIGFMQYIMDLFSNVLHLFNEPSGFVGWCVSMRRFGLCGCKGKSYINGAEWLKSQAYLKWVMANRVVNSFVVAMLHIRKVIVPCASMFGVVHL
jgi:hypothetical protein